MMGIKLPVYFPRGAFPFDIRPWYLVQNLGYPFAFYERGTLGLAWDTLCCMNLARALAYNATNYKVWVLRQRFCGT